MINPLLSQFPADVEIIAEPGRFFAHAATTLATKVIARRVVTPIANENENGPEMMIVLSW